MLALSLGSRLKTLAQFLTSLNQSQTSLYQSPPPSPIYVLSSPFSSKQRQKEEDDGNDFVSSFSRHTNSPPRLFVVQPRFRPDGLLQAKLSEALSLADSLEEQRVGYFETELSSKASPHSAVVQNPILRSSKARADTYFGPGTVETIKSHVNYLDTKARSIF
uniref:GTP-binding protein At3g49725ic n=1 Tax=Rhizophora mucronata TaxID=61149 RepID=A0A2P2LY28_RHIMU